MDAQVSTSLGGRRSTHEMMETERDSFLAHAKGHPTIGLA